jgi:hypothetical protein
LKHDLPGIIRNFRDTVASLVDRNVALITEYDLVTIINFRIKANRTSLILYVFEKIDLTPIAALIKNVVMNLLHLI